ncbi:D-hexose-6-phosphate mutarotase [Bifidobacterium sp. 64T4]|uniref:D-hexose-6-phosphate mutarotase n=1 Tax=Bifidobacterium pongonis TaxID=2834432 RepID=UPI001C560083|nr:D-hexose-6-phosphate mutarotase [Bifidobacterium pongonis]MBW3094645.1 D-hexose-6-phosphate mutarotase [Bifidobacterium pongonis]
MSNEMVIRNINVDAASATVSDYGAHVLTWSPRGESAVVWCPSATYLNEGKAIRGGVPIIFPWFNSGFENGKVASRKPKHGFGRVSFWEFDERSSRERRLRYTLSSEAIDDAILAQLGSASIPRFHAIYDIEVGDSLTMSLTVRNEGDAPFTYEAALHTYLHVGDVDCAKVLGLEGSKYIDTTVDGDPIVDQGDEPVVFSGLVDRIYYSTDTLRLRDDALGRTIVISKQGAPQTVVWNPGERNGNAIGDLAEGEWRRFVCVEAVANRDCAITVAPGESHTLSQTLSVE